MNANNYWGYSVNKIKKAAKQLSAANINTDIVAHQEVTDNTACYNGVREHARLVVEILTAELERR